MAFEEVSELLAACRKEPAFNLGFKITKLEKPPTRRILKLVEARKEILDTVWGPQRLYNHSFLCSVGLPHRSLPDTQRTYVKSSGAVSLQLTAGSLPTSTGDFQDIGLPYGPRARLLLLHLCSQAVLNRTAQVEVEDSFTAFARALGIGTCGKSLKSLRNQVARMSVVSMRLAKRGDFYVETFQAPIFSRFQAEYPTDHRQTTLFPSFVEFSHEFYISLMDHAVPLRIEAIQALTHSSRALDVYCWLAHRLWRLYRNQKIKWTSLRFQFGSRTQQMKGFKKMFRVALKQVLCVYPEANVSVTDGGVIIKPSKPPVPMKKRSRGLLT